MEIYYFENEYNLKRDKSKKIQNLNHVIIKHDLIYIDKSNIDKIIKCILCDFCDINIYGYNVKEKTYWGKQIINNKCVLMFTLEFSNNYIKINPIFGSDNNVKEFYINICEGLEIYKISPFLFE